MSNVFSMTCSMRQVPWLWSLQSQIFPRYVSICPIATRNTDWTVSNFEARELHQWYCLSLYVNYTFISHRERLSNPIRVNTGCVRLAFLGQPRCVAVFSSRTNVGNYLYTFVLGEKPSHTGVDPGKLIERTHYVTQMHVACVDDRKGKLTNFLPQTNQKHRYQKLCHVYPMKSLVL